MRYPSYRIAAGYVIGEQSRLWSLLSAIKVELIPIPTGSSFWIDGTKQKVCSGPAPFDIPEVTIDKAHDLYYEFICDLYNWVNSLKPGDQVTVEIPRGDPYDYPYTFAEEMMDYAGKTMTISGCRTSHAGGHRFSNGSDRAFKFVEDEGEFLWHSSMLEKELIKVTSVELIETDFDPLR